MDEFESSNPTKWKCLYHVAFLPKCCPKALYVGPRKYLGEVFRRLAEQKESRIEEGHLMADHVHMLLRVPPKYAVSQVVGCIKSKSAIHLSRIYGERKRSFVGQNFWGRGYFVSTVGRDEAATLSANGGTGVNIKPGTTVDVSPGSSGNLTVSQNSTSGNLTIDTNPNLTATSVTTGNTVLNSSGVTVSGGTNPVTLTDTGLNNGGNTITGVAPGTLSSTSTQAVNGSQLYATNQNISNLTNGKVGPFVSDNSVTSTQPVSSGANAAAGGFGASATGAASTVLGNQATDNGNADATVLGQGASIASGITGSNVALGQGSAVTAAAVPTASGTINGTNYSYAGGTPAGAVSVGTAGNERQITNVAAGQVTASSTDAINGSQLYATDQVVDQIGSQLTSINNGAGIKYFHADSTLADSSAGGTNSIAIGPVATAFGDGSIAQGLNAVAGVSGNSSIINDIAMGNGAQAIGGNSIAQGTGAVASSAGTVAIGQSATATGGQAVSIGVGNSICPSQASALSGQPCEDTNGWASLLPQSL